MNKLLALLFLMGTVGGLGMASKRSPYQVQSTSPRSGTPVGPVRTVYISEGDRIFYAGFGLVCMIACVYFVVRVRKGDSRG